MADSSPAPPRVFTLAEVAEHNSKDDCWLAIDGRVYDVTTWLAEHPGGSAIVMLSAGTDATELFGNFHNDSVLGEGGVGPQFEIGVLAPTRSEDRTSSVNVPPRGASALAALITQSAHSHADSDANDAKYRAVGGGNLFSTETDPYKGVDVTIPRRELSLLKNVLEMEELAISKLPWPAARFIAYGSEDESSRLANRTAWERYALRPRAAVGRNVTRVDLSTTVLGRPVALPLLLGPAGGHGIAHSAGEIAVARAAATVGTVGGIGQRAKFKLSEIHAQVCALSMPARVRICLSCR